MAALGLAILCLAGVPLYFKAKQSSQPHSIPPLDPQVVASEPAYRPRPPGTITFNKDIAPIVFNRCTTCHHAGEPPPFSFLTWRDVAKRAQQIVDVTQSNYMPPWLPERGFGDFANERRLTTEQKGLIAQWAREGAPEGDPPAPVAPQFTEGWLLGKPDLVVTMPEEYVLGADGPDVYRNFVIPLPLSEDRFVRALEFSPGNPRVVHHAFIKVDSTRGSRRLDARDSEPGFEGMDVPAEMPEGQFLCWQPGKQPSVAPPGLSWLLAANSDLLVQAHLNRSGKPEKVRSSIALWFTNAPPTRLCVRTLLTSLALDIPAGESHYVVTDSLTLPVDVQVLSILPHAHYLAREMQSYATLPDGTTNWLLYIKRWDFNWQGDYQYARPVRLPKGTSVHLRFVYDNSTNNLRNPNPVPKRVFYGPQSSDEMCEVWFQMVPANEPDAQQLREALNTHLQEIFRQGAEHRLSVNPEDVVAHLQLGRILFADGRSREAMAHFVRASELNPESDKAHYEMGVVLRSERRFARAKTELETALRLNPENSKAYGHLGFVLAELGDAAGAEGCFRQCLRLDPNDTVIREALEELHRLRADSPTR